MAIIRGEVKEEGEEFRTRYAGNFACEKGMGLFFNFDDIDI